MGDERFARDFAGCSSMLRPSFSLASFFGASFAIFDPLAVYHSSLSIWTG
jgi:hypothetical protein